ncbi:MAG: hypothetical protein WAM91_08205 [Candidatus Acidiferrales bacterium]
MSSSENIRGESEGNNFYDAAPLEPHLLYQGEVLPAVPILSMPKGLRWLLLRTRSGQMVDEALKQGTLGGIVRVLDSNQTKELWYDATEGDFAMGRLSKRPVLVLSQTCDIQTKQFVQVAPIYPVEGNAEHLEKLRQGRIISAFQLEPHPPHFPESYADLELVQAIHKSYVSRLPPTEHFRLGPIHVRELQRFITRYFGRPNSFDAGSDQAPVEGTYLCVSCFYMDGRVSSSLRTVGQEFEICAQCGGRGWILQGR